MNQYLLLRRLRGPAILLTFGLTALLNEYGVISYGHSWPLYLIVIGILQLAERAALSQAPLAPPVAPPMGYPPAPPPGTAITTVPPAGKPEEGRS
jgi:Domain of unknown function (DUF5668)